MGQVHARGDGRGGGAASPTTAVARSRRLARKEYFRRCPGPGSPLLSASRPNRKTPLPDGNEGQDEAPCCRAAVASVIRTRSPDSPARGERGRWRQTPWLPRGWPTEAADTLGRTSRGGGECMTAYLSTRLEIVPVLNYYRRRSESPPEGQKANQCASWSPKRVKAFAKNGHLSTISKLWSRGQAFPLGFLCSWRQINHTGRAGEKRRGLVTVEQGGDGRLHGAAYPFGIGKRAALAHGRTCRGARGDSQANRTDICPSPVNCVATVFGKQIP